MTDYLMESKTKQTRTHPPHGGDQEIVQKRHQPDVLDQGPALFRRFFEVVAINRDLGITALSGVYGSEWLDGRMDGRMSW